MCYTIVASYKNKMENPQNQIPIPIQKPSPSLSIKFFSAILLLLGLSIAVGALSPLTSLIAGANAIPNILFVGISIGLFLYSEIVSRGLHRLKNWARVHFYLVILLDALFLIFRFDIMFGRFPLNFLSSLAAAGILCAILVLPFLFFTYRGFPMPSKNPARDNYIVIGIVITLFVAGGIYSGISDSKNRKVENIILDKMSNQASAEISPSELKHAIEIRNAYTCFQLNVHPAVFGSPDYETRYQENFQKEEAFAKQLGFKNSLALNDSFYKYSNNPEFKKKTKLEVVENLCTATNGTK